MRIRPGGWRGGAAHQPPQGPADPLPEEPVQREPAGPVYREVDGHRQEGEDELYPHTPPSHDEEALGEVDLDEGHGHVHGYQGRSQPGEEAHEKEDCAEELHDDDDDREVGRDGEPLLEELDRPREARPPEPAQELLGPVGEEDHPQGDTEDYEAVIPLHDTTFIPTDIYKYHPR